MSTDRLPEQFWQGIEQFNSGEFYPCHDTLEALWLEALEPQKTFYQGILQIAVACHHLGDRNWRGTVILLGEGTNRLRRYEPSFAGIDVEELRDRVAEMLSVLQRSGAENVDELATAWESGNSDIPKLEIHKVN